MGQKYIAIPTMSFKKEYNKLKKRYPKIDDDFNDFLDEVEFEGNIGVPMQGVVKNGNKVLKKRMRNSSANKGLSGGFRIIEYLVTESNQVFLLDIYSKSNQAIIESSRIRTLIRKEILK